MGSEEFQKSGIRIYRTLNGWIKARSIGILSFALVCGVVLSVYVTSCATLPSPKYKAYTFPQEKAHYGDVKRPYETLGLVRSRVNFQTLDPSHDESDLCRNYFNKAVRDLIDTSKKQGGDAVIDIKSVVFMEDGSHRTYPTAECSDDGMEGQVLAQGIAIKWKRPKPKPSSIISPQIR